MVILRGALETENPDKFYRDNFIFTLNGNEFDLSDINSLSISETDPVFVKDGDIHVFLNCDKNQFDDLSHGNLKRYHDLNNNGCIELNKFLKLIDFLCLSEEETRGIRKEKMAAYIEKGHTVKEWMDKGK